MVVIIAITYIVLAILRALYMFTHLSLHRPYKESTIILT